MLPCPPQEYASFDQAVIGWIKTGGFAVMAGGSGPSDFSLGNFATAKGRAGGRLNFDIGAGLDLGKNIVRDAIITGLKRLTGLIQPLAANFIALAFQ